MLFLNEVGRKEGRDKETIEIWPHVVVAAEAAAALRPDSRADTVYNQRQRDVNCALSSFLLLLLSVVSWKLSCVYERHRQSGKMLETFDQQFL